MKRPKTVEPMTKGPAPISVPLGNAVARNVGGGGPAKGYTQYGQSGQQAQHGPVTRGDPRPGPSPDTFTYFSGRRS